MTCGRTGKRMGDLMQYGVGNLFGRVVCCMVSPELDDLLFLSTQTDGPPGGAEAKDPVREPVPVHEFSGLPGHFEEPLCTAVSALSILEFEQGIRYAPRLRALAYRRGSLIEFRNGPGRSRPALRGERHRIADIELSLYQVCLGQVPSTLRSRSKRSA